MEDPMKVDDLGVPLFQETTKWAFQPEGIQDDSGTVRLCVFKHGTWRFTYQNLRHGFV